MELKNKKSLVTGSSKGIGKSIAIALAKNGASIALNFKSDEKSAENVLGECNKYSKGNFVTQADISKSESVEIMINKIKEKFGRLDILINNAGIFDEHDNPINIEAFENIYHQNFLSHIKVTAKALEILKEGKIINISSVHGKIGYGRPTAIAYSAFKAALDSYTKNLAKDLAPKILVNAVAPGKTLTPMWGDLTEKEKKSLSEDQLIQRFIEPDEVADAVLFLLRNDAMCGEILTIDGGMTLRTFG